MTGEVTDESDNCDTSVEATSSDVVIDGACEGEQIVIRTWTLSDDCGNVSSSQIQTITIQDVTAPSFTVPADITIDATADCTYDASVGVTGDVTDEADNCDTTVEATFTDVEADGTCEGAKVITRTWTLMDDCGNAAAPQDQIITVQDVTNPTFTVPADITIDAAADCSYDASVGITGDITDEADNCDTCLLYTSDAADE